MKIAIFVYDGVTALDVIGPYESLRRLPDVEVQLFGTSAGPVKVGGGASIIADIEFKDIDFCDVLIFPGGDIEGVQTVMKNDGLLEWIRERHETTQWTASVCTGCFILGAAGLMKGLRIASHWRAREYLSMIEAEYSGDRITEVGKIITSAGVSAGIDLGLQLCELISGREMAQAIQLSMEYEPAPPFGALNYREATPELLQLLETKIKA